MNDRLSELWRISRTALADRPYTRHDRLQYVTREYLRENPSASRKQVYLSADMATRATVELHRGTTITDLEEIVDSALGEKTL